MQVETIITLVVLGVAILGGLITIAIAIIRGDMKKFIEKQMIIAEEKDLSGEEKLKFVLDKVKEEYKVLELVMNVRKFVEHIIYLTKRINAK